MNPISESTILSVNRFSFMNDYLKVFLIGLTYFFAHELAFFYPDSAKVIMLIWPAGGIGLAAFLLNPKKLWPFLTVAFYISGIIADVLLAGRSFITSFGFMTANMVESIGCAALIIYVSKGFRKFAQVREVLALITGAIFLNAFSTSLAAYISVVTQNASFWDSWKSWYVSDGLGILLVGPFIVCWFDKSVTNISTHKIIEGVALIIVWCTFSDIILINGSTSSIIGLHPYLLVALVIWPAMRFEQRGVTFVLILLLLIIILSPSIVNSPSSFRNTPNNATRNLLELQLFTAFLAAVGYLMAAGYTSLTSTEKELRESENRFSLFMDYLPALVFIKDHESSALYVNKSMDVALGASKWIGLKPAFVFNSEVAAKIIKDDNDAMLCGFEKIEESFPNLDGQIHYYETQKFIIPRPGLEPLLGGIAIDISDRKRIEENLSHKTALLEAQLNSSQDGIIVVDSQGKKTLQNKRAIELWKIPEDIANNPDDSSQIQHVMRSTKDPNQFVEKVKYLYEHPNESSKDIIELVDGTILERFSAPVTDDTGKYYGRIWTFHDITERKQAEIALNNKERYQRALLNNFPFAVWLKDTESRFLAVNRVFADTFKIPTTDELIGKTDFDIADHKAAEAYRVHDRAVMQSRQKQVNEEIVIGLGERNWSETYKAPVIDEYGELLGTVGFLRDISERKKYEESLKFINDRFKALIQMTLDGFWIVDLDGKILEVNDSYCNLIGYSKEQLLQMKIKDVEYLENEDEIRKHNEQIAKSGWQRFESKHKCADGKIIDMEVSTTYMQEQNIIIAFMNDTSKRKHDEAELEKYRNHLEELVKERTEELKAANDELTKKVEREEGLKLILQESLEKEKEVNEMKSRFISTTSHEFRTPLTAILSSSGLLQKYSNKWDKDKQAEHFERIGNSVSYLVKLLDDILTISHADSGKINFSPELIHLKHLVKECIVDAQNLSASHHVNLSFNPTQEEYLLDQKLMKFILNNLLSNAIKYSPDAKDVNLSIACNNSNLIIEVIDKGIGIPNEEIGNIFESFYRSKNIGEIRGTGLGLAIVKRAVDLQGGEITVSSELNIGTSFSVKIPVK